MGGCNPQNDRIEQLYHEIYDKLYRYAKNALRACLKSPRACLGGVFSALTAL